LSITVFNKSEQNGEYLNLMFTMTRPIQSPVDINMWFKYM